MTGKMDCRVINNTFTFVFVPYHQTTEQHLSSDCETPFILSPPPWKKKKKKPYNVKTYPTWATGRLEALVRGIDVKLKLFHNKLKNSL